MKLNELNCIECNKGTNVYIEDLGSRINVYLAKIADNCGDIVSVRRFVKELNSDRKVGDNSWSFPVFTSYPGDLIKYPGCETKAKDIDTKEWPFVNFEEAYSKDFESLLILNEKGMGSRLFTGRYAKCDFCFVVDDVWHEKHQLYYNKIDV